MLYLASQSPRRRQLLRQLGRSFRVVRSQHQERIRRGAPPSVNAMRNAVGKTMKATLPRGASGTVIGADTFLYFQGRVIGKPRSLQEARRMLHALSGRSHWVYTGFCVRSVPAGRCRTAYEKTRVTFKQLSDETITRLFSRASPLDKAGGYALQADRGDLIARLEGSRSNVIGLPLERLKRELRAMEQGS